MAGLGEVKVPIADALKKFTVTVRLTGRRRAFVRLFTSKLLLRLARWVSPTQVEIVDETTD